MTAPDERAGPLCGVRVLDLSRILAGPTCTQILGDLGADVIKVERPGHGDDTRSWGPPFLAGPDGEPTGESAYYLAANRNKRSITVDLGTPGGQALVRDLAARSDVLVENFKVGGLDRFGLDFPSLGRLHPGLVYCSITGFGQTGPRAHQTGYDFLVQAMGGIMSLTGPPEGPPFKAGVGVADVVCGLYAATAILAALRHRDRTGEGQHIDLALFDAQVSWLVNAALGYLTTGTPPVRHGNAHPHIVPYQTLETSDGFVALAVGNDAQFARLCDAAGVPELAADTAFRTNAARVANRAALIPRLERSFRAHSTATWIERLERAQVPCGPVNDLPAVFDDPQTRHRGMRVELPHPASASGSVSLLGSPLALSRTPVRYRRAPPTLGADTDEVLRDVLGLDEEAVAALRRDGAIGS